MEATGAVFLDFPNAFDTVWHEASYGLVRLGVGGHMVRLALLVGPLTRSSLKLLRAPFLVLISV